MLFTIAIPTYNNEKTIESTIKSCINQTYPDQYEILVVNNCCTDNTNLILNQYSDRITIYKNEKTVSLYENHNICLSMAKGDYIIFCHSDDTLLEDSLTKYYSILNTKNFPKRYVLWGRSMFRDFYNNWKNGGFYLNQIATGNSALDVFQWGGLTPSGTCYSRKEFLEIGGFVKVNHKLAPSDIVSMWKLVMNNFEFEMSEKLFFIRYEAGTATGILFNQKNKIDSISDAILCLRDEIPEEKFKMIIDYFKLNVVPPRLGFILRELKLISSSKLRNKYFLYVFKKPNLLSEKLTWRILFR